MPAYPIRNSAVAFVIACALASAPSAVAQKAGPNGGLLAGKVGHETELVVTPAELRVYLIDHGKIHSIEGVRVRAVISQDGKTRTVALVPDGDKFVAKLPAPLAKGAIVVITGKDDHGDAVSARYILK
jgi:hypothetical protein